MMMSGDSLGGNALLAAAQWVDQLVLGQIAKAVAIIAVASVGVLALTGRVELRRGATIILGCFIIFGAPSIARGLQSATTEATDSPQAPPQNLVMYRPIVQAAPPPSAPPYDPYAGASVPPR